MYLADSIFVPVTLVGKKTKMLDYELEGIIYRIYIPDNFVYENRVRLHGKNRAIVYERDTDFALKKENGMNTFFLADKVFSQYCSQDDVLKTLMDHKDVEGLLRYANGYFILSKKDSIEIPVKQSVSITLKIYDDNSQDVEVLTEPGPAI